MCTGTQKLTLLNGYNNDGLNRILQEQIVMSICYVVYCIGMAYI